jgi:hypothetical protein
VDEFREGFRGALPSAREAGELVAHALALVAGFAVMLAFAYAVAAVVF